MIERQNVCRGLSVFFIVLQFSAMAFAGSVRLFSGPNQQRTFPSFIT